MNESGVNNALVKVQGLKKYFEIRKGLLKRLAGYVKAVDNVSFDVRSGETFGLVGESGCGKTTIGRTILRALDPTAGDVWFTPNGVKYNLAKMDQKELRRIRPLVQMIFQDPYSSLSPRMTVKDIISEYLVINRIASGKDLDDRLRAIMKEVDLNPQFLPRYPHAFSGGQRQRVGIARALVLNPKFIVADEPVSALDVSVQAQILELMLKLKAEYQLSYLFISHDLSVVKYISDRIGVMYVGKLVEVAEKKELYKNPYHPYTGMLLSAIPRVDATIRQDFQLLKGEVPDPSAPPPGCYFHPRCPFAQEVCKTTEPPLRNVAGENEEPHFVACHFAKEVDVFVWSQTAQTS